MTARKRAPRRAAPATQLTAPVEDYLKAIYAAEAEGEAAGTNALAQQLGIAAPSVSGMIRRLADQGLVAYARYHGVRLTQAGRRAALRTLRRHRVIEAYLVKALGYQWDTVHAEAERLEHSASDDLIDRMAEAIGEPRTDPHGAPIPTRDGVVDERRYQTLSDLKVGERARVVQVSDEDGELLRYLARLGLRPGITVSLRNRAPFDGPITVQIGKATHQVGPVLSSRVMVEVIGD